MFCSNCRVIEIPSETRKAATCENGHCFCEKCELQTLDKCMLCEGRMITEAKVPVISNAQSANIAKFWSTDDEISDPTTSGECCTTDYCMLSERRSTIPLQEGYSNSRMYDDEASGSHLNRSDLRISDCYFPSLSGQSDETEEDSLTVEKERLRSEIVDEILTSFGKDPMAEHYKPLKYLQTVGVSTESMPRLPQIEHKMPDGRAIKKTITIQATAVRRPGNLVNIPVLIGDSSDLPISKEKKEKCQSSNLELKLQQVLGTISEPKPEPSMPPSQSKIETTTLLPTDDHDISNVIEIQPELCPDLSNEETIDFASIVTSSRACYKPQSIHKMETVPQFEPICVIQKRALSSKLVDVSNLIIPRSPIFCPISTCCRAFFVSDFSKHIAFDHTKIPCERIRPKQCWNYFLDSNLIHLGSNKCQVLLLVRDKIKNLGHDQFKDLIPIMVMTTKISLLELCSDKYSIQREEVRNSKQNFVMIWLTGLVPPQLPIYFCLSIWARSGCIPICHVVHSGRLYSMRESQSSVDVQKSGQMILLSENQVNLLTNNGRRMLEIQVTVQ